MICSSGTQGWLWTWWETLKTSTQRHLRPALGSRETLPEFVWGNVLTVSCTPVHQQIQGSSLADFYCEPRSLNLTLWEDLCSMSLWYLGNVTGEMKKVPFIPEATGVNHMLLWGELIKSFKVCGHHPSEQLALARSREPAECRPCSVA